VSKASREDFVGMLMIAAAVHMQVQNALHMGWVDYCAALITAKRMQQDIDGRTLVVHNGDVSYAECAHKLLPA